MSKYTKFVILIFIISSILQDVYCASYHKIKLPKSTESTEEKSSTGNLVELEEELLASTAEHVILSSLDHVKMALIRIKDAYVKKVEKVTLADIINTVFDNVVELIEDGIIDPDPNDNYLPEDPVTTESSKDNFAGSSYNKDVIEVLNDLKLSSSHSDDSDKQLKNQIEIRELQKEDISTQRNETEETTTLKSIENTEKSLKTRRGSLDMSRYYSWPSSFYYY